MFAVGKARASLLAVSFAVPAACGGLAGCAASSPPVSPGPGYGTICYAGNYTCQLSEPEPLSTQCACPGIGAPSFGAVR